MPNEVAAHQLKPYDADVATLSCRAQMLDKLLSASSVEIFPVQLPTKETFWPAVTKRCVLRCGAGSAATSIENEGDRVPCS